MPSHHQILVFLAVWCLLIRIGQTSELLPPDHDIPAVVDHYIDQALQASATRPASAATFECILRRTTLDLAGRIPTPPERKWFLQLPDEQRRALLVDRLMTLPDFDLHLRNELAALLLPEQIDDKEFRDYLLWASQQKRTWDVMFRDMMLPTATEAPQKGAEKFLQSRLNSLDDLTNDTTIVFFGVNISCAKCHDHPLVEDWRQDHFYGMQSFFSRTYKTKNNFLAEKFYDEVRFKTTSGEEKTADFMFLTGDVVPDGTPEFSDEDRKAADEKIQQARKDDKAEIPIPEFSPRSKLVDLALQQNSEDYFAKNIVNRIWQRLLGTGIVDPPDQMHRGNPPGHPELLEWLARDLRAHQFDVRRLIRGITLSRAYARSSSWKQDGSAPTSQSFGLGKIQPLTPRQLAASLLVAAQHPGKWPAVDANDEWQTRVENLEQQIDRWWREFEQPSAEFQVAVDEALFFSNNPRIEDDIMRESGDRLMGLLKDTTDDQVLIEILWNTLLVRSPDEQERETAAAWLNREGDRTTLIRRLTWGLLAGPEFRFNH